MTTSPPTTVVSPGKAETVIVPPGVPGARFTPAARSSINSVPQDVSMREVLAHLSTCPDLDGWVRRAQVQFANLVSPFVFRKCACGGCLKDG